MNHDSRIETKAIEALRLMSFDDSLNNWCNLYNLPKTEASQRQNKIKGLHAAKLNKYCQLKANNQKQPKTLLVLKTATF